jgi:hypothetical protein
LFLSADGGNISRLDGYRQVGVSNWWDVIGKSFNVTLRGDVKCDKKRISFTLAHTSELDGLILKEQFFILQ